MTTNNLKSSSSSSSAAPAYRITPLKQRSATSRLDILPFTIAYILLVLADLSSDPPSIEVETGLAPEACPAWILISYGLVLLLHFSIFLISQWDVTFRALIGFRVIRKKGKRFTHCLVEPSKKSGEQGNIVPVSFKVHPRKPNARIAQIKFQEIVFRSDFSDGDVSKLNFQRVRFPVDNELSTYISSRGYETAASLIESRGFYGMNQQKVPAPSFVDCLAVQLIQPFFLFQVFCVILWCLDEYWYYAIFTLVMLCLFECTVALQRLKSLQRLRESLRPPYYVLAYRQKKWIPLLTDSLVAGDLVSVTTRALPSQFGPSEDSHQKIPCDMLVLKGSAVVNEAMLTGESVPQVKEAIDSNQYPIGQTLDIDDPTFRRHIIFGGTFCVDQSAKQSQFLTESSMVNDVLAPPDQGCICFVLRTGFESQQGQLLRTLIFSGNSKNGGVNNFDNFVYICILLLCALTAASTVITATWGDDTRNKFKLVLHVIIILTSVVPPELPMELSLAVTSSLSALVQQDIYCTEQFRIPLAGEIDTCCFDKTGTLTSDEMRLRGLRCVGSGMLLICKDGTKHGGNDDLITPQKCELSKKSVDSSFNKNPVSVRGKIPRRTLRVLIGCQSLSLRSDGTFLGDPLELAVMKDCGCKLRSNSIVDPSPEFTSQNFSPIVIQYRFAFESRLKRMTVLANDENDKHLYALTKGAPEVVKSLLKSSTIPPNYDKVYRYHMAKGQRVLCLAFKSLGEKISVDNIIKRGREFSEKDMTFCGFAVLDCPLKPDSFRIINELQSSAHNSVMITGDASLTAAEVARQVGIIDTEPEQTYELRELKRALPDGTEEVAFAFVPINAQAGEYGPEQCIAFVPANIKLLKDMVKRKELSLCLTGEVLTKVAMTAVSGEQTTDEQSVIEPAAALHHPAARIVLKALIPLVSVFARHSPRQKAAVIRSFNESGCKTLMCGDGTNDVGALKEAHVGISIISAPEIEHKISSARRKLTKKSKAKQNKKSFQELVDAQEELAQVSLGDASMASPFTSRTMSIKCCKDILLRGRCTLVTMLQIYKILGVNCLVNALVLTKLYFHGVKQGDRQLTALGLVVAALFLFVTKGKPLNSLSSQRPPSSVLCAQALVSIAAQFVVHLVAILTVSNMTIPFIDPDNPSMTPDGPFNPNPLNTACFLILVSSTISTFVVNYRGRPFMQTFKQNKLLLRTVQGSALIVFICAIEIFEPLNQMVQLSPLPSGDYTLILGESEPGGVNWIVSSSISMFGFKATLCLIMILDAGFAYAAEKMTIKRFG